MKKRWTWDLAFEIDALAGESYRTTGQLDGREYEINIAPAEQVQRARERRVLEESSGQLGGLEKQSISLGPRGGGCPCCGR